MNPDRPEIGYGTPPPTPFRFTMGHFGLVLNTTAVCLLVGARAAAWLGWGPRMSGALTTALLASTLLGLTGPAFSVAAWRRRPRARIAPAATLVGAVYWVLLLYLLR